MFWNADGAPQRQHGTMLIGGDSPYFSMNSWAFMPGTP
jgi:hypothetical protein